MGGWSDGIGSDGAGMQKMPKVAHVQMMVMMLMIGDVQANVANHALDAQGCPCLMSIPDQDRVSKLVRLLVIIR